MPQLVRGLLLLGLLAGCFTAPVTAQTSPAERAEQALLTPADLDVPYGVVLRQQQSFPSEGVGGVASPAFSVASVILSSPKGELDELATDGLDPEELGNLSPEELAAMPPPEGLQELVAQTVEVFSMVMVGEEPFPLPFFTATLSPMNSAEEVEPFALEGPELAEHTSWSGAYLYPPTGGPSVTAYTVSFLTSGAIGFVALIGPEDQLSVDWLSDLASVVVERLNAPAPA